MRLLRAFTTAGIVCALFASPAWARDVVQSSGTSDSPSAQSGSSGGTSSAAIRGGARSEGGSDASASQKGSNHARSRQVGSTGSGDAVAGTQTATVAGRDDAGTQQQNASDGAASLTGATELSTGIDIALGPEADGSESGRASQDGSNAALIRQVAIATSGDAVAGAQITGIIGADVTVQNANVAGAPSIGAGGGVALDGDAVAASQLTGVAADSTDVQTTNAASGATPTFANSGAADSEALAAVIVGPAGLAAHDASSQHLGDNAIDVSQTAGDTSSAALAAGPVAASTFTAIADPLGAIFSTAPAGVAAATQTGDDDVRLSQLTSSISGDALSGSQVSGVAAVSGAVVQASHGADDAFAASGTDTPAASAFNVAAIQSGPVVNSREQAVATQIGDVRAFAGQHATAHTGDAVAGSQVASVVTLNASVELSGTGIGPDGSFAFSGHAEASDVLSGHAGPVAFSRETAQLSLVGDVATETIQHSVSSSGDAVSSAQMSGLTDALTRV